MKKTMIAGISAAALAAGVGLGATQLANADSSASPTPSASSTATNKADKDETAKGSKGERRGGRGIDQAALAKKLGVSEDDLSKAVDAAREATRPSNEQGKDQSTSKEDRQAAFAKALAKELGVDEAKVTAALKELREAADSERAAAAKEKLAEAVKSGTLTQEEADAVQKAVDKGIASVRGEKGR